MLTVLNAIGVLESPSLGFIATKTGLDRKLVISLIQRAEELAQVKIKKIGLLYTIEDWGLISGETPLPNEVALIEACIRRLQTGKPIANVERREYIALYKRHTEWFTIRNYPSDTAGIGVREFQMMAERRMRGI